MPVELAKLVLLPELDILGELGELVMLVKLTELARLYTTGHDVVADILPVTNIFMIIVCSQDDEMEHTWYMPQGYDI